MIPVEQIHTDPAEEVPAGDCIRCCIASILELPRIDVPHFVQTYPDSDGSSPGWWNYMQEWLGSRGLVAATFELRGARKPVLLGSRLPFAPAGYWIGVVRSALTGGLHAVVMRGGELVWNPNPLSRDLKPNHDGFHAGYLLMHGDRP